MSSKMGRGRVAVPYWTKIASMADERRVASLATLGELRQRSQATGGTAVQAAEVLARPTIADLERATRVREVARARLAKLSGRRVTYGLVATKRRSATGDEQTDRDRNVWQLEQRRRAKRGQKRVPFAAWLDARESAAPATP